MKLIENIIEPRKLFVLWQAIDKTLGKAAGERFVVGEVVNDGANSKLSYYDNDDTKAALEKGFKGLTTYPFEPSKICNGVESVLAKRLPPSSRSDYDDYLRAYRISPTAAEKVSSLALLANTTGNLTGDGFTFSPSFEGLEPPFQFAFDIAGFGHNNKGATLEFINYLQGAEVHFEHEKENDFDSDAVTVCLEGKKLGYAPKGINKGILDLKDKCQMSATIERINGTVGRPNILVFVEVK